MFYALRYIIKEKTEKDYIQDTGNGRCEDVKYVTPFYFSNASDIFTNGKINGIMLGIGIGITAASFMIAWFRYRDKDLAV